MGIGSVVQFEQQRLQQCEVEQFGKGSINSSKRQKVAQGNAALCCWEQCDVEWRSVVQSSNELPVMEWHSDPSRLAQKSIPLPMATSTLRYQPEPGFLSQYANYLNEQFLNRPLDDANVWNSTAAAAGIQSSTSAYGPSQNMPPNYDASLTPNIRNYPMPPIQTTQCRYPQETGLGSNGLTSYQSLGPSSTLSRLSSG
uniref:Uncharacterized protein n=1 Tax=Romanomermis culicivorax TaxID=13658 RepID=A0A915HS34_ROMCU